jgi:hypothetical protein
MQCLQPEYERTWHRAPLYLVFRLHLTMPRHECDNRHDAVADPSCEVSSSNPNCQSRLLQIDTDAKGSVVSFLSIRLLALCSLIVIFYAHLPETLHQYSAFLDVDQSIGIGDLTCSDFPAGGGGDNHNLEFPPGAL